MGEGNRYGRSAVDADKIECLQSKLMNVCVRNSMNNSFSGALSVVTTTYKHTGILSRYIHVYTSDVKRGEVKENKREGKKGDENL